MWHLNLPPYAVQTEALKKSQGRKGFAFFLEQGLGKTGVILSEIMDLYGSGDVDGAIGVTFKSLLMNWKDEAVKMGWTGDVYVWPDIKEIDYSRPFLVMVNFEVTINEANIEKLEAVLQRKKIYLFCDESSALKNPKSKRTKAFIRLSVQATVVRVSSGTPITQNVGDVWAQLKSIGATRLRYLPFRNRYCVMGGYMGKQVIGSQNEDEMATLMREHGIMSKKADWTDLPAKIYMPIIAVELSPKQKQHYKMMAQEFMAMISGEIVEAPMVLTQMIKLQQLTSGYIMNADRQVLPLFEDEGQIPKIVETNRILESIEGKTLIFAVSRYSLDVLSRQLAEYEPIVIRGGMTNDTRKAAIDTFNSDPTCRVAVIQTQSGGHGLTLLGSDGADRCHTTIYYENDFSLDRRLQSEDRNHRHGQDFPVNYYDFAGSPIERSAVAALQTKKTMKEMIDELVKTLKN